MQRTFIKHALAATRPQDAIVIKGWVRTKRDSKGFSFLEINDGSCLANIQAVVDHTDATAAELERINTGAAVEVRGELVASPGKGQAWEIRAESVACLGEAPGDYPLQKKRHTDEYLRTIAHLRPRSNKYGALNRIRSSLAQEVHRFFADRGFFYIHTPILTGSDCEGAGEMFRVTAGDPGKGPVDPAGDFFGRPAHLTVSGQLEVEMLALSLGSVYTFGPTFRAENSNTPRHAAEFWMIEPEVAFADLDDNMDLGEAFIKHLVRFALDDLAEDVGLFAQWVDKTLADTLALVADKPFARITYTEAIEVLEKSGRSFEYPVSWGMDLQTEHERFICEEHCKRPVFVYDYPASLKPFYMRVNDGGKTVRAMDCLVPRIGEIIGGSQREERFDVLKRRMDEAGLPSEDYWWYLDSRRFGSAPHSGFGLGFERLVMLVTGVTNIRDAIPFPRTPRNLEF